MTYLQAAIFDMDGVVTDTAELHYKAWKLTFDEFLDSYSLQKPLSFQAFTQADYLYYVDGIPRCDGVKSFLASRHINLAEGSPHDEFAAFTIYGLSNRKDFLFQALLKQQGVKCFSSTIQFIKQLRQQSIKTAIISSSKNCQALLKQAGIEALFDTRIDGKSLEQLKIPGKPRPDIFLAAAEALQIEPYNIMIVEDALAGVQAGYDGKFGLIIGIDRQGLGKEIFREHGADIIVTDLTELTLEGIKHWFEYQLQPVFINPGQLNLNLLKQITGKPLILLLDYDGTLTPIVDRPELAILEPSMRNCLSQLSRHYPLAVISGRELNDIQQKIGLANLYYAGNHGLEIAGPMLKHIEASKFLTEIAQVYQQLLPQLKNIPGILIENKRFSLSVHYRLVADTDLNLILQTLNQVLADHPNLKRHDGKKVFEIRPQVNWNKGKAVHWLLTKLQLAQNDSLTIYIGDDTTDEDAFRAIKKEGLGILVTSHKQPTAAHYCLRDTTEVKQFLEFLLQEADLHESLGTYL